MTLMLEVVETLPRDNDALLVPAAHPDDLDVVTPDLLSKLLLSPPEPIPELVVPARHIGLVVANQISPLSILGLESSWLLSDLRTRALARTVFDPYRDRKISLTGAYEHEHWLRGRNKPAGIGKGDKDLFADDGVLVRLINQL